MSKFQFLSGQAVVQRIPYVPLAMGRFIPVRHAKGQGWGIYDQITTKVHRTKVRMRGHRAVSTLEHWPDLMSDRTWEDVDLQDWRLDE